MHSFAILAMVCAATIEATSALIAPPLTRIRIKATGYDERSFGSGCSPEGCVPENTRDGSRSANSRWTCKGDILDSSDDDEGCCITYCFEEPQDVNSIKIAFYQGTSKTRQLDVFDNDNYHSTIESSGKTNNFQTFNLNIDETEELKLCLHDPKWNSDVWLSITEVDFVLK